MRNILSAVLLLVATGHPLGQSPPFEVLDAGIDDVRSALGQRRVTCRALVEQYLRRIEAYDKVGPALNAVQTLNRNALQEADLDEHKPHADEREV